MKNTFAIIMVIAVAVLSIALLSAKSRLAESEADVRRLKNNQEALCDTISSYRILGDVYAYKMKRLEMTKNEFERTNNGLKQKVEDLKIKVKQLESADKVVSKTEYVFIPDTIIVEKPEGRQRELIWSDDWLSFRMGEEGVNIEARDTVFVVRHVKVKKFLWLTRRRDVFVTVTNANPHTKTTQIESITIEK